MFPKNTKILYVDDMAMFRVMVKTALTSLGYNNLVEAQDGEEAWNLIADAQRNKVPFGLIISDWSMPKLKGIDLLKKVRGEPWGANFPFVLLTGEAEKQCIMEALENKVSQYIIKPFAVDQLKQKLEVVYLKTVGAAQAKKSA